VHGGLLAQRRRRQRTVLAETSKDPPFRPRQAETILVDAGELPTDQIGQMLEPIGKEAFQFEDFVSHDDLCKR
jgi:hypothetical protein